MLSADGIIGRFLSGMAASSGRYRRTRHGFTGGRFCPDHLIDRFVLGSTNVGDMVGMGCPTDFYANPVFLYLGYMALADGFERAERGSKPASLLLLVGVINLPIIKFSVDWWNTLHQGSSVLRLDGPSIDPTMLKPLLIMALAMLGWFIAITILRMNSQIMRRRITNLEIRKAWS